jgi:hypothetical protein
MHGFSALLNCTDSILNAEPFHLLLATNFVAVCHTSISSFQVDFENVDF